MTFGLPKSIVSLSVAILVTGALLNYANKGKLGDTAKKLSRYITEGYGAGAFPTT